MINPQKCDLEKARQNSNHNNDKSYFSASAQWRQIKNTKNGTNK
jgi:hypothetical protein